MTKTIHTLENQNLQWRQYAKEEMEDRDDIIASISSKSLQQQTQLDELLKEASCLQKDKNNVQTDLSMALATQEQELSETRRKFQQVKEMLSFGTFYFGTFFWNKV